MIVFTIFFKQYHHFERQSHPFPRDCGFKAVQGPSAAAQGLKGLGTSAPVTEVTDRGPGDAYRLRSWDESDPYSVSMGIITYFNIK